MVGIKKSQLYGVIGAVRAARIKELEEAYSERKRKAIQKIIDDNQLEMSLKTIHANLLENKKLATPIVSVIPVSYCDVKDASYDSVIKGYEEWKARQFSHYISRNIEVLNAIEHDYTSERSLILDEFEKVEAMVKQSTSIKKAMALLEEIGFDLSGLEPEVKFELTTTSIRKDLLGLGSK